MMEIAGRGEGEESESYRVEIESERAGESGLRIKVEMEKH